MKRISLLLLAVVSLIPAFAQQTEEPARKASANDIIRTIPDGATEKVYKRSSRSYYNYQGGPAANDDYGFAQHLYFYDNGDVYMYVPFALLPDCECYIKGHMEGDDKLVFSLPQPAHVLSAEGESVVLSASRLVYKQEYKNLKPSDNQDLVFNIDADGVMRMEGDMNTLETTVLLGLVSDYGIWYFYAEQMMKLEPLPDDFAPVKAPAGVEFDDWMMTSPDYSYYVGVGTDNDNNLYIRGIFNEMPNSTVKGRIEGDKVTFEDGQYLGEYENHLVYALSVDFNEYWSEEYGMTLSERNWLDASEGDYSAENQMIKMKNSFMINASNESMLEIISLRTPLFRGPICDMSYTNPIDPAFFGYIPWSVREGENLPGYGTYAVTIRPMDTNFVPFDLNNFFYEVYFNYETTPYTFKASEYDFLDEDMSLFPYQFTDGYNFKCLNGNQHYVYYWRRDAERIGIRTLYNDNGTWRTSNVVYSDGAVYAIDNPGPVGIDETLAEKTVKSIEYYDLAGRRIEQPERGLYIKTVKYSDGSTRSEKMMK